MSFKSFLFTIIVSFTNGMELNRVFLCKLTCLLLNTNQININLFEYFIYKFVIYLFVKVFKLYMILCLVLSYRSPSKGPNTVNALSKRVRFGARIVTKNGRDAHRELNGFFFSADNTLTLYEFHQFGTRFVFRLAANQ